jgi:hypothetical protein
MCCKCYVIFFTQHSHSIYSTITSPQLHSIYTPQLHHIYTHVYPPFTLHLHTIFTSHLHTTSTPQNHNISTVFTHHIYSTFTSHIYATFTPHSPTSTATFTHFTPLSVLLKWVGTKRALLELLFCRREHTASQLQVLFWSLLLSFIIYVFFYSYVC